MKLPLKLPLTILIVLPFIVNQDQSVDWLPIYSNAMSGISKADGIGCGVMLVKTKVFKAMEEPYFYFEQLGNNKILGEDIYFCIWKTSLK